MYEHSAGKGQRLRRSDRRGAQPASETMRRGVVCQQYVNWLSSRPCCADHPATDDVMPNGALHRVVSIIDG